MWSLNDDRTSVWKGVWLGKHYPYRTCKVWTWRKTSTLIISWWGINSQMRTVELYFSLLHPMSCGRLSDLRYLGREPPSIKQGRVYRVGGWLKQSEILKIIMIFIQININSFSAAKICVYVDILEVEPNYFHYPLYLIFTNELIHNMHTKSFKGLLNLRESQNLVFFFFQFFLFLGVCGWNPIDV